MQNTLPQCETRCEQVREWEQDGMPTILEKNAL